MHEAIRNLKEDTSNAQKILNAVDISIKKLNECNEVILKLKDRVRCYCEQQDSIKTFLEIFESEKNKLLPTQHV